MALGTCPVIEVSRLFHEYNSRKTPSYIAQVDKPDGTQQDIWVKVKWSYQCDVSLCNQKACFKIAAELHHLLTQEVLCY